MQCPGFPIPGVTVAVVNLTDTMFMKGFGFRDTARTQPVDVDTLFGIGSCTKAFTATLLAMCTEKVPGMRWDSPVRDFLRNFTMLDPLSSASVVLADLMAHRSGLSRNDMSWVTGGMTGKQWLPAAAPAFLPQNYKFRTRFEYNNIMVASAGMAAARAAGAPSWRELLRTWLLAPLGMKATTASVAEAVASGNYAQPFDRDAGSGAAVPIPLAANEALGAICPAGCISSSAREMATWLRLQLGQGSVDGMRLLRAESLRPTHEPQMTLGQLGGMLSFPAPVFPAPLFWSSYGFGWFLGSYRGEPLVMHGGNDFGHSTMVALLPLSGVGVFLSTSINGEEIPQILLATAALDAALGRPSWLNQTTVCTFPHPWVPSPSSSASESATPGPNTPASNKQQQLPRATMSGIYSHPVYGDLSLSNNTMIIGQGVTNLTCTFSSSLSEDVLLFECELIVAPTVGKVPLVAQFQRTVSGDKDDFLVYSAVAIPGLDPSTPPVVFTNEHFQPRISGWPMFEQN